MNNREAIQFLSNVPVQVALKYADGRLVDGTYGPRVMYTTIDDKVMFLDTDVAAKINQLEVAPNESFWIVKQRANGKGLRNVWKVWREQQPQPAAMPGESALERDLRHSLAMTNGKTAVVDKSVAPAPRPTPVPAPLAAKLDQHPAPAQEKLPPHASNGANRMPPGPAIAATYSSAMAEFLLMAGRAVAQTERALGAEGAAVKFDSRDVAALATTFFIQAARDGRVNWKPGEVA